MRDLELFVLLLLFVPLGDGHLGPVGPPGGGGVVVEGSGCGGGVRPPFSPPDLIFLFISGEFTTLDAVEEDVAGWVDGVGGGGGGKPGPGSRGHGRCHGRGGGHDGKSFLGAVDQLLKLNFHFLGFSALPATETLCCCSAARSSLGSTTPSC